MTIVSILAGLRTAARIVGAAVGLGRAIREGTETIVDQAPERTDPVKIREQAAGSSAHSESRNAGRAR